MELHASVSHPMVGYTLATHMLAFNFITHGFLLIIQYSVQGKHLVSVGGYIYIWDWRSGELITKLQATSSCSTISSVSFSSDAKFFVTAGKKHLKFWILGSSRKTQLNGGISRTTSLAIHEKPANLSILKGSSFTSITSMWGCSGHDNCKQAGDCFPIYTLTDSGLMQFRESLRLIFVFKILRHSCFLDWHDVLATSSISFLSVYLHFAPYSFSFCLQAFYTLLILGCWSKSL